MEVKGIVDILDLCWIELLLESSEIIFVILRIILSNILILWLVIDSHWVFVINSLTSCLGKTFTIKVFTCDLRNEASVSWKMLSFNVRVWSTNPVSSFVRVVTVLNSLDCVILTWRVNLIIVLFVIWF